jgi:hypothetical protein
MWKDMKYSNQGEYEIEETHGEGRQESVFGNNEEEDMK